MQDLRTDAAATADFYELDVARHHEAATVLTSNRSPDEWLAIMIDPLLAQSAVDWLTSTAHELIIEGQSYRRRTTPTSSTHSGYQQATSSGLKKSRWGSWSSPKKRTARSTPPGITSGVSRYWLTAWSAMRPRATLARMSSAVAVHTNGLGSLLCAAR
ncbi:ATP-binding protein [Mycobacterium sp.]|uniref:ATP-binding protein n=2 Tax=Mycobacterium sp. TaxID=1785 RepID=UPI003F96078F